MPDDRWTIGDDTLSATIKGIGAELCSLRDGAGREWLWQAGPAWARHAPVLFPIVGRLRGDSLRSGGTEYRMTQHGFARDRRFAWTFRGETACSLSLSDDAQSREIYPFPFRLEIGWAIEEGVLTQSLRVENPGEAPLPFSLGLHPAFAWPLPGAEGKAGHRLEFGAAEAPSILRLDGGLMGGPRPSPIAGNRLDLHEGLFVEDAIVLEPVVSRRLRYVGPQGQALTLEWDGFPTLGIWSKPDGADFLCLEPWQGHATPAGWDGEFSQKPGVISLAPGAARDFSARFSLAG